MKKPLACCVGMILALVLARSGAALEDAGPRCDRVRFFPAPRGEQAMVGGKFQGSNVSRTAGFEVLAEIKTAPPVGQWSALTFESPKVYRWLRYEGPPGSHGKIAEVEFYAGDRKLSGKGPAFGAITKFPERSWQRAFDEDTKSWTESDAADGAYIGIDLREQATARRPRLEPEPAEHDGPLNVALKCPTPGTVLRYTFDGTMPTADHGAVYHDPIRIEKSTTIQAVALLAGRAPSPPTAGTYLLKGSTKPGLSTFHWGNSLTQTTAQLASYARTAGHAHQSAIFGRPGAWTKELWNVGLTQEAAW